MENRTLARLFLDREEHVKDSADVTSLVSSISSSTRDALFFMDSSVVASPSGYIINTSKGKRTDELMEKYALFYKGLAPVILQDNIAFTLGVQGELDNLLFEGRKALTGEASQAASKLLRQMELINAIVCGKKPVESDEAFHKRFIDVASRIRNSDNLYLASLTGCDNVDKKEVAAVLYASLHSEPAGLITRDTLQAGFFLEMRRRLDAPAYLVSFNPRRHIYRTA